MINIILSIVIIVLILKFITMEKFQINCDPYTKLEVDKSYNSLLKGTCTNADFGTEESLNNINTNNKSKNKQCPYGTSVLSGNESYKTDSKGFCK